MQAVVSLLDPDHYRAVEALWAELEQEFGLRGIYETPFPHFSYHVAPDYNLKRLEPVLRTLAAASAPFTVQTCGLGVFTGLRPVLYIPVVRTPELTAYHEALWPAVEPVALDSLDYYRPERWVPHITIGFGDMDAETVGRAMRHLSGRELNWEIQIDHLALISDGGTGQALGARYPFVHP